MLDLTTVICTRISHSVHLNALRRCVESIKTFVGIDETKQIVIVDSDSPDKSYINEFVDQKYIHVENIQNKNYEAGAWKYAYNKYSSKRYLFIHDNTYLINTLDVLEDRIVSIFYALNTWEAATGEEIAWVNRTISNTYWNKPPERFTAISGSMLYVHRNVLDDLISKGLFDVLPENKMESQAFERYFGAVLAAAGYESELLNSPKLPLLKDGFNRQ